MTSKVQCATCINHDLIWHGETQDERNRLTGAIQDAARKYGCSDYFRSHEISTCRIQ